MSLYLGVVKEVVNSDTFIIKAQIKGFLESVTAYPFAVYDQPEVGEPILLETIESIFGMSFIYNKDRLADYTRLKLTDSEIGVYKDKIKLQSKDANILITNENDITITSDKANIKVDKDNNITLTSDKANIVIDKDNNITLTSDEANIKIDEDNNITLKSGDNSIEISSEGKIDIKSEDEINVESKAVTITGGTLETKGTVEPEDDGGPFCAVTVCPFTGLNHAGSKVKDT
jgi:hypothetical protein